MPELVGASKEKLYQCDKRLVLVCEIGIKIVDFSIITGHRVKEEQEKMFLSGLSQIQYPYGKHNRTPSKAVDFAPYPIDWADTDRFIYVGGILMGIGISQGIKLRWGGDWKGKGDLKSNQFNDLGHIELIN